jgi:hypothetical protein
VKATGDEREIEKLLPEKLNRLAETTKTQTFKKKFNVFDKEEEQKEQNYKKKHIRYKFVSLVDN